MSFSPITPHDYPILVSSDDEDDYLEDSDDEGFNYFWPNSDYSDENDSDEDSDDDIFPFVPQPMVPLALHMILTNSYFMQLVTHTMMVSRFEEDRRVEEERIHLEAGRKLVLQHLPSIKFSKSLEVKQSTNCAICLCEFEEEEKLKKLPCEHHFHGTCIDTWIMQQSVCPLCKGNVGDSVKELNAILRKRKKEDKKKLSDKKKKSKEEKVYKKKEKKNRSATEDPKKKIEEQSQRREVQTNRRRLRTTKKHDKEEEEEKIEKKRSFIYNTNICFCA